MRPAVNRKVVGSSPTPGAIEGRVPPRLSASRAPIAAPIAPAGRLARRGGERLCGTAGPRGCRAAPVRLPARDRPGGRRSHWPAPDQYKAALTPLVTEYPEKFRRPTADAIAAAA